MPLFFLGGRNNDSKNTPNLAPNKAPKISLFSTSVNSIEQPEKKSPAVSASKNIVKVICGFPADCLAQRNIPMAPNPAAMGKTHESDSFFTVIANKIKKKDCVNATTGETNETAPEAIALYRGGKPIPPQKPAIKPITQDLRIKPSRFNKFSVAIMTKAAKLENLRVVRQLLNCVDLPPKVLVAAVIKAFEKAVISPIN